MPEPDGKVRVRLDIAEKSHDELRVLAARSGMSMARYCETIVLEAIAKCRVLKSPLRKKRKDG